MTIYTGMVLRSHRKRCRMTQKEVALAMEKSQQWVSDTEHGVTTLLWEDIQKICKIYRITPNELAKEEQKIIQMQNEKDSPTDEPSTNDF